jgi:microcystin-dependent protein
MDNYLSSVVEMALWWTPEGFLPCDGRKLSIRNNEALFSLLGANYGGDGVNDFALPQFVLPPIQSHIDYRHPTL